MTAYHRFYVFYLWIIEIKDKMSCLKSSYSNTQWYVCDQPLNLYKRFEINTKKRQNSIKIIKETKILLFQSIGLSNNIENSAINNPLYTNHNIYLGGDITYKYLWINIKADSSISKEWFEKVNL